MKVILRIEIDQEVVERLLKEEIERKVEAASKQYVFWDSTELKRRTCMSWNTMQEHFFHDPDFPKVKVGGKWYFPAKEAEVYLEKWLKAKIRNKGT